MIVHERIMLPTKSSKGSSKVSEDFLPGLFHPLYFIRKGLYKYISTNAYHLSGRMMDFGCGSKPYKALFNVEEYIGVDYENEGHPHLNEQIDVFYDGKDLPFPDQYFDSILCSEVIEHIFNLDHILKELNRILKSNGKMLITCPFVWNEHEMPNDFARYSMFALESIMKRNGFEILEYEKSGDFITTITQLVTLYFYTIFHGFWRRYLLTRFIYKSLFFFTPNLCGYFLSKVLPTNHSLYLNNILVVRKVADIY